MRLQTTQVPVNKYDLPKSKRKQNGFVSWNGMFDAPPGGPYPAVVDAGVDRGFVSGQLQLRFCEAQALSNDFIRPKKPRGFPDTESLLPVSEHARTIPLSEYDVQWKY